MNLLAALTVIFVLALAVEGIVEYLLPTFPERWKFLKTYIAAGLAIGVALAYQVDMLAAIGLPAVWPWGSLITGALMGRGANFLSVFYKRAQVVTAPAQPVDTVAKVK